METEITKDKAVEITSDNVTPKQETKPAKKPRKAREKVRTLKELEEVPLTKMTQKELILCYKDNQKELHKVEQQLELLKGNLNSAYEAKRMAEEAYNKLLIKVNEDIAFIQSVTATHMESILRVTKKGQ